MDASSLLVLDGDGGPARLDGDESHGGAASSGLVQGSCQGHVRADDPGKEESLENRR